MKKSCKILKIQICLSFACALFYNFQVYASPIQINLEKLQNFSGKSKEYIIQQRIKAVHSSPIFKNQSYTPNPSVFQIQDNAPWISAYEISCYGTKNSKDISKGESSESLGILNPELLLYTHIPNHAFSNRTGCSNVDYLIPYSVYYDASQNMISARINYSAFYRKNKIFFNITLEDANAHDLGYNYVFAEAVENIEFLNQDNLSTSLTNTNGFYHLGSSCGKSGGCNNYSPHQTKYDLRIKKLPAGLKIKAWKQYPQSQQENADMIYVLIFD